MKKTTVIVIAFLGLLVSVAEVTAQDRRGDSLKRADCAILLAEEAPQGTQTKKVPPDDVVGYEKEPGVVTRVEPKYPQLALKAGLEGDVLLKAFVDESGVVVDTRIVSGTDKMFEEAATEAARRWKFTPALSKGKPVAAWITIPFRFVLSASGGRDSKEFDVFVGSLQAIAMNIIQGREFSTIKSSVAPEAYVIDGNHYENLFAVLNGEVKTCKVVEGPGSKMDFFNAYVTDDMKAACLVLKTRIADGKRERYHTVLIVRQPGGEWKIRSWHISG